MRPFFVDSYEGIQQPPANASYIIRSHLSRGKTQVCSPKISTKMLLSGAEVYTSTESRFSIRQGQFLITAPAEELELTIASSAVGCCFYMDVDYVHRLTAEMISADLEGGDGEVPAVTTTRLPLNGSQLGLSMLAVANHRLDPDADVLATSLAETTVYLSHLRANLPCRRQSTQRELVARLEVARTFLIEAQDRAVSLRELESACCLSRFHLNRSFARVYGTPPLRFHQNLRLDAARERLGAGEPQRTIAEDLGFSALSSFSRAYRRRHHHAPSADQPK
ncbi:helix-turn-helix domain-containing protein [Exilibacterium tricleocarpae]|uniref:Helix-turn-helix domain-containing protein n=1 Tax=Exilibacterium tricleocarpae TaxID=2591008 RepID=A0A545TM23_9GAMM|nr:helix-turn-helix domain-containing protein [Exilibacterium tricleocarpae]TQV78191.1 helix-turn-helix domain-containing protein [Exilibacterium tricleocarpae]